MNKFNTQGVTNTAWVFATAGQFDASLFVALANAAKLNMNKSNAQDVTNTAWAFATAGQFDASLCFALAVKFNDPCA